MQSAIVNYSFFLHAQIKLLQIIVRITFDDYA